MGRRFGQIDIYATVALLSQQLALQQVGHLEVAVYYIFAYLKKYDKSCIIFDPTNPMPITLTAFKPDWSSFYLRLQEAFYLNLQEDLPPKIAARQSG